MFESQKHVFWQALILAVFIFASGILLGYFLEQSRTSKIISLYQQSELDLLDMRIQESILSMNGKFDCDNFFKETINFANKVYDEAVLLERYEGAGKLSEGIVLQHKKYDLLRAILWTNSIRLREKCGQDFTTLVYFYEYNPENLDIKSTQDVFSNKLGELRTQFGDRIILIPIAGNLEISSIDLLKSNYGVTKLPAILVDEKNKIESLDDLNSLEGLIK